MPGGVVPDEHEGPFTWGGNILYQPGQKGTGDLPDGTPQHKASQHVVGPRYGAPLTGHGFTRGGLGGYGLLHEPEGRSITPGMPLGLGWAPPPPLICAAQSAVCLVGRQWAQPIPAFFFAQTRGRDGPSRVWRAANCPPGGQWHPRAWARRGGSPSGPARDKLRPAVSGSRHSRAAHQAAGFEARWPAAARVWRRSAPARP
jgi:hypothetical protein